MMKPEVRDLWLGALESGQYKQAKGVLISKPDGDTEYCCLGVLSQLHADATGEVQAVKCATCNSCGSWEFATTANPEVRNEGMPLDITYRWSELDESDAAFLSELNDAGTPFMAIAAYIRRHL